MWQRLVEHGSQVSISVIDLADSPCPITLSPGGITSRRKSYVVPSIRLRIKKNEYSDIGVRIERLGHGGGLVCRRNKYKVTTIKKTLSKVGGIK